MSNTPHRSIPRAAALAASALLAILFHAGAARAQWATSGDNINNTNTGNVGVGTSAPAGKLEVKGGTSDSGASALRVKNASDANLLFVRNDGKVGIGTAAPAHTLDVVSGETWVARFMKTGASHGGILVDAPAGYNPNVALSSGGAVKWYINSNGNMGDSLQFWNATGEGLSMTITQAGNVGIGTWTNPTRKLDLGGDVGGLSFEANGGSPNSGVIRFGDNTGWKFHFGRSRNSVGGPLNSGTSGVLMTIQDNGNVGVGTTSPGYKLDVQGGAVNASGGLCIAGDCKTAWSQVGGGSGAVSSVFGRTGAVVAAPNDYTWAQINKTSSSLADITTRNAGDLNAGTVPIGRIGLSGNAGVSTFLRGDNTWGPVPSSQWTSGTNNISYNTGSVGIGTANPTSKLHMVSGTDNGTTLLHLDTGVHGGTSFTVAGSVNNESAFDMSVYRAGQYFSRIGVTTSGHVYLAPNTAADGNVGIGTTTPTSKLHVVGDITVTGNISAKYQDVAEWVPSTQRLAAGTLVVLDPDNPNHVLASTKPYDTGVAGVISERPGIALGEQANGKVLVATTGRVRLKADATRAPIRVGDLLVTSDTEGVAMKSQPLDLGGVPLHRPGTLIGKALEPLEKGVGEILVLLSLQ